MSKKTFIQFLQEKAKPDHDVEEKFKDVDCDSEDLTDDERDYCAGKKLVKFLYKSHQSQ